jgi:hypothetical protein
LFNLGNRLQVIHVQPPFTRPWIHRAGESGLPSTAVTLFATIA